MRWFRALSGIVALSILTALASPGAPVVEPATANAAQSEALPASASTYQSLSLSSAGGSSAHLNKKKKKKPKSKKSKSQSAPPAASTGTASQTTSLATAGTEDTPGSGRAGPAQTVTLARSAEPPRLSSEQIQQVESAQERRSFLPSALVPDDPAAQKSSAPPRERETSAPKSAPDRNGQFAANDLILYRNTALGGGAPSGFKSTTNEPSASNNGTHIFYTGNWYAALSTDSGTSFSFINPFTAFPSAHGGFCCDQVTIYDPSRNITIWLLQYATDGANNNTQRFAISRGQSGLATNTWTFFDLTAADTDFGAGNQLDYPHLALSSNFLYMTTNVFNSSGVGVGTIIFRFSLDELAALTQGTRPGFQSFRNTVSSFTYTPVAGATSTMYFFRHNSTSQLILFSWPESAAAAAVTSNAVNHSAFPNMVTGVGVCTGPDGTNMCGFDDSRPKAGWVAAGVIGLLWDAAQGAGGLGNFNFPYIHVVRVNEAAKTLIDEPIIFNPAFAWIYPGLGVNARGHLGVSAAFGGGATHPSSAILVRDDISPAAWAALTVRNGTNGPGRNRWGDYLTVRPASGNGNSWVGTSFTEQGPCTSTTTSSCDNVEPRFLWFGRERDNPVPICAPRSTVNVSTIPAGAGRLQVTVTASNSTGGTGNQVLQLSFEQGDNVQVEIGGQVRTLPFTFTVSPPASPVTFFLIRQGGGPFTVQRLVVSDLCGQWTTLAGGGANVP